MNESIHQVLQSAKLLLLTMPDPIYITDPKDRIVWVNDAFEKLIRHADDPINQIAADYISRAPSLKDFERQAAPIRNDRQETIACTVVLKPDERIFRVIAENTTDTIVLVDHNAIVRYVSPSIETIVGYSVNEYEGMDAFGVIHPDDRDRVRYAHAQALTSMLPAKLEYRVIHAHGHTVYAESRVKPVVDAEGRVQYVVAVVRDVTERKKTEQLLDNILDNMNAVVLSTDKEFSRYTYFSGNIEKLSGLSREAVVERPILLHQHMHPEDDAYLMTEGKHLLDQGLSFTKSIRYNRPGEGTRWIRLSMHPYLDHSGEIERLDGIMVDITDLKRSELALEESEQRYKSLFENNLDGVFSIELEGLYFVNANRAFETITGIRLDQLTDRCFMGLICDEDQASLYETLFHVMHLKEPRDIECRIMKAGMDRGERIVSITFVPIFLSGELNGIHGIVKDITERKKEERELIQSEERYKSLQQSLNRFSNELANVMKVSELEQRLIDEVMAVLPVSDAAVEEVPRGREASLSDSPHIWIKIGERKEPVYLRIELKSPLRRIEEEWLDTAVHYATILYDNLHHLEDVMKRLEEMVRNDETPKWMLRLLFKLSEKERSSLSSDLHDSVLQDLIIWYRKLESLRSAADFEKETKQELLQIEEGLLDAIHQIRITCNELRPPFLLKMGLVESLKGLFSYSRMFANYEIDFSAEPLSHPLHEEQILGVYRIVQELLNNASKHSEAAKVTMSLSERDDRIVFTYSDDGVGMDLSSFENSFQHMGIAGIEKRVLSLEGEVNLRSAPNQGFHVTLHIPTNDLLKGERNGNLIGR